LFNAEVPELSEPDYEAASVALGNVLRLIRLNPGARFTVVCEWKHPLLAEIGACPNVEEISPHKE
jgi:7-cyano-7-deazaguanine tRNA-ribosyltransferase